MELLYETGLKPIGNKGERKKYGMYICPSCGKEFECIISNVIKGNTTKCHACAKRVLADKRIAIAESNFATDCSIVHDNKYDYSKVLYKGRHIPVEIICLEHGPFWQKPREHKDGSGCQKCTTYGFNKHIPAILYYLKVVNGGDVLYKIGITNNTVEERFQLADMAKITVIATWKFSEGKAAYEREQEVLREYKEHAYLGDPVLSSGNTELFTINVLNIKDGE